MTLTVANHFLKSMGTLKNVKGYSQESSEPTVAIFLRSPSGRRRIVFAPPQSQLAKPVSSSNLALGEKHQELLLPAKVFQNIFSQEVDPPQSQFAKPVLASNLALGEKHQEQLLLQPPAKVFQNFFRFRQCNRGC
jgi:hypothetical protein